MTGDTPPGSNQAVARISMSLPGELLEELDQVVGEGRFPSRSQAINIMVKEYILEHKRRMGTDVMVGTITLFYYNSVSGLQKTLADLQYAYIAEVISSLHVHLIHNQTMEVILVQGPAQKLQAIAEELITLRGVIFGRLQLVTSLIPQLHPFAHKPE
jgi:CopG family nickel-responsive transcriptional regulator